MASRNVALRMDAYHRLDAVRRPGESFSDAVIRILGEKPHAADVVAGFDPLPGGEARAFDRELRKVRKETEQAMKRRSR
jgi:predicted CopG family antitoxin